jgi:hypothetical protein
VREDSLFSSQDLRSVLEVHIAGVIKQLELMSEDEVLRRSSDDLVEELVTAARIEPLVIGADPVDGSVVETTVDVSSRFEWGGSTAPGYEFIAVYEFTGDPQLFRCRPSQWLMTLFPAEVGDGRVTVSAVIAGRTTQPEEAKRQLDEAIGRIRTMAEHSSNDVDRYNAGLSKRRAPSVESRKAAIQKRRDLSGALGFPLSKRADAPSPVPVQRKNIGVVRSATSRSREPYRDEPALSEAQYEDAIKVVQSTLLAMERTPSVASGKDEEELRDQILVQLNGTFEGAATGETFVQRGKTDLLVRVEDRHVFVGECKWWSGEKAFGDAIDQLLSYLPWRDEKAALILFIDRKDASAVIEKADQAVRAHRAYKRVGKSSRDPKSRRNYILGQPDDPEREIQLAVLFAVLPAVPPSSTKA